MNGPTAKRFGEGGHRQALVRKQLDHVWFATPLTPKGLSLGNGDSKPDCPLPVSSGHRSSASVEVVDVVGNRNSLQRVIAPTTDYPVDYVRRYDERKWPLDVLGNPGPPSATHIPQNYRGPWPGWP